MQRVDLTDFSAGISEQLATDGFTDRQWSKLKGFVIDSESSIRSQWALQKISDSATSGITSGAKHVAGFGGSSNNYLVVIAVDGSVWQRTAPSDTANTGAFAVTGWSQLTAIPANTNYRFVTEFTLFVSELGEVNALLIGSNSTDMFAVYENDLTSSLNVKKWERHYPVDQPNIIDPLTGESKTTSSAYSLLTAVGSWTTVSGFTDTTAPWSIANDGPYPIQFRLTSTGPAIYLEAFDSYTAAAALTSGQAVEVYGITGQSTVRLGISLGSFPAAQRNVMPYANTGTSWRNRLLLGDTMTRRDSGLPWFIKSTITNKVLTSNVATLTTSSPHHFLVNDVVKVYGVDSTFNGTYTVTAATETTFSYAKTATDVVSVATTGFVIDDFAINYRFQVTNKSLTSNVATLTIGAHSIEINDSVVVRGVDATFNGTYTVTAVTPTTISYAKTSADIGATVSTGSVLLAGTSNIMRNPFSFWFSEAYSDTFFEQSILSAASGESQLLGMHVIDDYLITIASPSTNTDGLWLFRGDLNHIELQEGTDNLQINIIRGGVGPTKDLTNTGDRLSSCAWPEAGIVVLLDRLGGVWYTNGIEVDRLDRIGPIIPNTTSNTDSVAALGRYLFVNRGGRLLLLNMLSQERGTIASAAWTELVLPNNYVPTSMRPVGGSMYMVLNGEVFRFAMSRSVAADSERGRYSGSTTLDLTVGTPTLADADQHTKTAWFRVGVRSRGLSSAVIKTIKFLAGPTLASPVPPSYTTTLNRTLVGRDESVALAGVGSAVEGSAEIVFTGDVQVESVTFWTSGRKMSRPADGSDA
jgi:hypothetical protein